MNDNENIQFGAPTMLWVALVAAPCLAVFFVWVWRRKQAAMSLFIPSRLFETLLVGYSPKREQVRYGLLGAALVMSLLALTAPRWGYDWEEVKQKGLDIVVAVDTSRSMLAPDIAPNRLERSRLACIDLMRVAKTDRLGLVAFAGSAFLQCPLTFDDEAFRLSLNALDVGIIPQGGSSLAEAIKTAQESFKQNEDNHKVLILITDGEDHEEGAVEAAKAAAKGGIKIYTIGAGTPNGELLSFKGENGKQDFIRDDEGNIVRSKLNEGLLREIATAADGFYLPLAGAKTMETLYQHPQGLGSLPKTESNAKFVRRYQERFQWPLAIALGLLLLEWVLQTNKASEKTPALPKASKIAPSPLPVSKAVPPPLPVNVAVVVLLLFSLTGNALATPSEARSAYDKGDYRAAFEEYLRLSKERPDDARLHYNAGASAYRAGDYEASVNQFNDALRTQDLDLQRDAYYNRANARYLQGRKANEPGDKQGLWESSLADYERALQLKKDDADAAFNRDLVKRKLEELKKQQEQQKKQDNKDQKDQDNKDDQKDQQKQDKQDGKQKKDSKQNEQQSKDQEKNQKQDPKQNPDQKKQGEKDKQEQAKKDQQKQDEQKGDKDSAQQQAKKQSDGKADKQSEKKPDEQGGQPMMAQGNGEMTQQQVMQLLDALKSQEKALIFQPPGDAKNRPRNFKDW